MFIVFEKLKNGFFRHKIYFSVLLLAAFLIQIFDFSDFFNRTYQGFHSSVSYQTPLRSAFWESAIRNQKMILYYPREDTTYYIPLGLLAAPAGAGINVALEARFDRNQQKIFQDQVLNEMESGRLRSNALYVFKGDNIYQVLKSKISYPEFFLGRIDGLYVGYRK
jgi:hypothetical protein